MTAPRSTTSPDDTTRKIDLNVTQVAAAALAAVTSAVIGSRLGAVGTLIGAAGASVVTTVGTAVYRASLDRSRERVRALAQARRTRPLPPFQEGFGAEHSPPTVVNVPPDDERLTGITDPEPQPRDRSRRFPALRWGVAIGAAVGAFLLAMMVITGFELVSGQTVGDNGEGTTIGRVVDPAPVRPNPAPPPASPSSAVPTSETPTVTTEAPTATSTPDGGTSVEQSPSPTSGTPTPSESPPPLIPTDLPGVGD
ncbi:MAG: hypothetical protein ACT4NY_07220 [Pseudonocardiales bacterium]